jgi:hypothetical protein
MMRTPVEHPLSDALSLILPSPEQTWFLRALLLSGEPARQAWDRYRTRMGDPRKAIKRDRGGIKTLAPLLDAALRRNGIVADDALLTSLRTASLREELRSRSYRRIVRSALSALAAGGVRHAVVGEAALAETVYDGPALRHCHKIDLLLPGDDVNRAAPLLLPAGFDPPAGGLSPRPDHLAIRHGSGLPLELHSRLPGDRHRAVSPDELWTRSQPATIAGLPTRVLSPADNLLHACALAPMSSGRESLVWVSDAWHLITRCPDLDWEVLLECTTRSRLALPLSVTIAYLAGALDAPVPPAVVDRARAAGAQADTPLAEALLSAAVLSTPALLTRLARLGGGWRPRVAVVKWILFPSPGYVRSIFRVTHPWLLPAYYVYRPLRYVARRVRRRWAALMTRDTARSGSALLTPDRDADPVRVPRKATTRNPHRAGPPSRHKVRR